jgi:hypothetical protein
MLHSLYLDLVGLLKGHYKAAENEPCSSASKGDHYGEKKANVVWQVVDLYRYYQLDCYCSYYRYPRCHYWQHYCYYSSPLPSPPLTCYS